MLKNMTLADLQKSVNLNCTKEEASEIPVLVTLNEPSVGPRASSPVVFASMGFDWEHGQFRISVKDKIIRDELNRDIVVKPIEREYSGKKTYWCKKCGLQVKKTDCYCSHCGQKLKEKD